MAYQGHDTVFSSNRQTITVKILAADYPAKEGSFAEQTVSVIVSCDGVTLKGQEVALGKA